MTEKDYFQYVGFFLFVFKESPSLYAQLKCTVNCNGVNLLRWFRSLSPQFGSFICLLAGLQEKLLDGLSLWEGWKFGWKETILAKS